MGNQTEYNDPSKIDNPDVLALSLRTAVNHKYDGPNVHNPNVLPGKCVLVLLLPRILDVLCFWGAAGIFFWNQENGNYKYFAKRILNPGSTTNFWHTFLELKTILATVAFAVIVALVFLLRVAYLKAKRVKEKETIPTTMQSFPNIHVHQGGLFFSTLFFALLLFAVHFVVSLILRKHWDDMPLAVDLGITAGILALTNLFACIKVESNVIRCHNCHVISSMINQEFKVLESFLGDATVKRPESTYKKTEKIYHGERIQSSTTTNFTFGEYRTYANVQHDRVSASCRCPYCLVVYDEVFVDVNDDLSNKKLKDVQAFTETQWRENKHGTFF